MDALQILFIIVLIGLVLFIIAVIFGRIKPDKKRESSQDYINALEYILRGRKKEAISQLRKIVKQDTENIDAYLKLGTLLRETREPYRAYQIHRSILLRPGLKQAKRYYINREVVLDLEDMGEISRAIGVSEELLSMKRKDTWALRKLWNLYFRQSNWEKAAEYYKKYCDVIGADSRELRALYVLEEGLERFNSGRYKEARVFFRKALKIHSKCASAMYYMGEAYIRSNREKDAVEWLTRFAQNEPHHSHLIIKPIQKILFDLGNFGAMEELFNKLLEKDPENIVAQAGLADFRFRLGNTGEALHLIETALEKRPDSHYVQLIYIKLLADMGKMNELKKNIEKFLTTNYAVDNFYCENCQFESSYPRWLCPRCGTKNFFRQ